MTGSFDYRLVTLSVVMAVCAAYAALDLAGRTTASRGRVRLVWLAGGAAAMGLGIWSMHYIGMLAFLLPVPVFYDWPTVLVSLFAAIFASGVALFVVSRRRMDWGHALAGSAIMGSGITTMHYIGMAAMRLPAVCHYDSLLVVLSVAVAIGMSLVALWLSFHLREHAKTTWPKKCASAVVMGAAVAAMHYTGMAAASFTPSMMAHVVTTVSSHRRPRFVQKATQAITDPLRTLFFGHQLSAQHYTQAFTCKGDRHHTLGSCGDSPLPCWPSLAPSAPISWATSPALLAMPPSLAPICGRRWRRAAER